jgi:hypothetical protein
MQYEPAGGPRAPRAGQSGGPRLRPTRVRGAAPRRTRGRTRRHIWGTARRRPRCRRYTGCTAGGLQRGPAGAASGRAMKRRGAAQDTHPNIRHTHCPPGRPCGGWRRAPRPTAAPPWLAAPAASPPARASTRRGAGPACGAARTAAPGRMAARPPRAGKSGTHRSGGSTGRRRRRTGRPGRAAGRPPPGRAGRRMGRSTRSKSSRHSTPSHHPDSPAVRARPGSRGSGSGRANSKIGPRPTTQCQRPAASSLAAGRPPPQPHWAHSSGGRQHRIAVTPLTAAPRTRPSLQRERGREGGREGEGGRGEPQTRRPCAAGRAPKGHNPAYLYFFFVFDSTPASALTPANTPARASNKATMPWSQWRSQYSA